MKKTVYFSLFAAVLAFGAASCSDKDSGKPEEDPIEKPSGTMEVLTPEESKEFLEEASTDFLNKFNPKDQQDLIELAAFVDDKYGYLDMPDGWEFEENSSYEESTAKLVKAFGDAFGRGLITRATTYAYTYSIYLDFSKFGGVYEPGTRRWNRTGDSNDVIFKFEGPAGEPCELKAALSGGYSEGTLEFTEEDYYDYWDEYYIDEYTYKFKIPKKVTLTLTQGGKTIVTANVNSDINFKGHTVSADVDVTAANLRIKGAVSGNDKQISQASQLYVDGDEILSSYAKLNGEDLCNFDYYQSLNDKKEEEILQHLFQSGEATVSLMKNRVLFDGTATYSPALYEAFNTYYDSDSYSSKSQAETAIERAIQAIEDKVKVNVKYNNTNTIQATLGWTPSFYEWDGYYYSYWEYELAPVLKFPDGTSYEFEQYFSDGFEDVEDAWSDLQRAYERMWERFF